jgi:transcriptional regulator with XRE-family HTH domain
MTQSEIATALGIKETTWSAWEAGRTRPHDVVELAGRLEQQYGVPAAWTLGVLNNSFVAPTPRKAMDNGTVNWGRRQTDFLSLQRTRMRRVVHSQSRVGLAT